MPEIRQAGSDRRVKALALTPSGIDVRNGLIATIAESPMFNELTRTQQRQLADLLRRCVTVDRASR